jgi:hypothetical protein
MSWIQILIQWDWTEAIIDVGKTQNSLLYRFGDLVGTYHVKQLNDHVTYGLNTQVLKK